MLVPFPERVPGKQGEIPRPLGRKRRQRLLGPGFALGVLIPFIRTWKKTLEWRPHSRVFCSKALRTCLESCQFRARYKTDYGFH